MPGCRSRAKLTAMSTPENAHIFAALVDCFIIGTGINRDGDFHNFDPAKLERLMAFVRRQGEVIAEI